MLEASECPMQAYHRSTPPEDVILVGAGLLARGSLPSPAFPKPRGPSNIGLAPAPDSLYSLQRTDNERQRTTTGSHYV